jgi:hypothetical protein
MTSTHTSDTGTIQQHQNDAPSKVKLMIHHRFPGVELVSPVYACDGVTCHLTPDQRVDIGSTTQAGFNIDPAQETSICILIYKLERKNIDQSNKEVVSSEEATCIQLVIIWEMNSFKEFCVNSFLIEHIKSRVWDRDGLIKLAKRHKIFSIQHSTIEGTWLMYNSTALMMSLNVIHEEEGYKLEMIISKGGINKHIQRPEYIDLIRQVLMLVILITIFT